MSNPLSGYGVTWRFLPGPLSGALWFWAEPPATPTGFKTFEASRDEFQRSVPSLRVRWWQ